VLKPKTPWRDGTRHLVMSTLNFIRQRVALVLRPRQVGLDNQPLAMTGTRSQADLHRSPDTTRALC
jgi:hypothetical protein